MERRRKSSNVDAEEERERGFDQLRGERGRARGAKRKALWREGRGSKGLGFGEIEGDVKCEREQEVLCD